MMVVELHFGYCPFTLLEAPRSYLTEFSTSTGDRFKSPSSNPARAGYLRDFSRHKMCLRKNLKVLLLFS